MNYIHDLVFYNNNDFCWLGGKVSCIDNQSSLRQKEICICVSLGTYSILLFPIYVVCCSCRNELSTE